MSTYATLADLDAFTADFELVALPDDPAKAQRILDRAERDVDRILGPYERQVTGLKLDPQALSGPAAAALARAVCAQAVHRIALGEDWFSEPDDLVTGDIRVLRAAERISGRVYEELSGFGLMRRSGMVPELPEDAA